MCPVTPPQVSEVHTFSIGVLALQKENCQVCTFHTLCSSAILVARFFSGSSLWLASLKTAFPSLPLPFFFINVTVSGPQPYLPPATCPEAKALVTAMLLWGSVISVLRATGTLLLSDGWQSHPRSHLQALLSRKHLAPMILLDVPKITE